MMVQARLLVALLAVLHVLPPPVSGQGAASAPTGGTIRTPEEFAKAFNNNRTASSVDPCLFATIAQTDGSLPTNPYPPGFSVAWASGYRSLEQYLKWNKEFRNNRSAVVGLATQSVGWGPPPLYAGSYYLFVYDACALAKQGVYNSIPTVPYWVIRMKVDFGIDVPIETLRTLTVNYFNLTSYTGCNSLDCLYNVSPDFASLVSCGCSTDFVKAWKHLSNFDPFSGTNTTKACYAALQAYVGTDIGRLTPAVLRTALLWCEQAGGWNTGNGLSWYRQNGMGFYSFPEFVIENKSFKWMKNVAKAQVAHVLLGTIS